MPNSKYDSLKLESQLCFPLYAAAREIIKRYKPFLDEINLTYTQYIAMMIMWEKKSITVKQMGEMLYLDSGTLTPLLKKLEEKAFVSRNRSKEDERSLIVEITPDGEALREKALSVPGRMAECSGLDIEEARTLYRILYKILGKEI